ncbi:MarR family winged helix-turn-helix transcriptional regulator [Parerythrobacter aurantius]|uniref:MarR family winged helix-turn-helix transcriptional regulator n=1 Tax=Parerythrobacter aurantius TaxID=3127706 RepID=UPI00324F312D
MATALTSDPQSLEMARSLRVLIRAFMIDEQRLASPCGGIHYNGPDFQSLHFISDNRGCRASDVAAFLGLSATTMQSVIDRLVRRGLVERHRSTTDRRAVSLALSEAGQTARSIILAQDSANCSLMLSALGGEERELFVEQLRRIAQRVTDSS